MQNEFPESIIIPHPVLYIELSRESMIGHTCMYAILLNENEIGDVRFSITRPEIQTINIEEKYQQKGIGEAIYRYIEKKYYRDVPEIEIEALESARPFWEKMGFKTIRIEAYDERGKQNILTMKKKIKKNNVNVKNMAKKEVNPHACAAIVDSMEALGLNIRLIIDEKRRLIKLYKKFIKDSVCNHNVIKKFTIFLASEQRQLKYFEEVWDNSGYNPVINPRK